MIPKCHGLSWLQDKGPGAVGSCTRPCLIYSMTTCTVSPAPSSLSAKHTKLFTTKHMFTPPAFALKAVYCNLNIFSYPLILENSRNTFCQLPGGISSTSSVEQTSCADLKHLSYYTVL